MEPSQETENKKMENNEDNNKEEFFTNIFSQIGQFEKNKRYQVMQNGLNSLKQNVKLLEEFSNKEKLSNKKKIFSKKISILNLDKENNLKKVHIPNRNSIILRKKMSALNILDNKSTNNINTIQSDNNLNRNIYNNINKKRTKKTNSRTNNLSMQKYELNLNKLKNKLIYKTEVNNYNQLINGEKLPNIYYSSDKRSEANIGSQNSNTNSTSRLPLIYDKNKASSQKKIYLYTDNNDIENIYINENIDKKNSSYKKIPLIRRNLKYNTLIKKYPNILNSNRDNHYTLNHENLPVQTDKIVRRMKEKNVKIKNKINFKINEQELIDWEMKSKFKLAKWKYGIAEVDKYFIDLQAYGKPEEEELLKRKTFYDYVEDLIDDIKKTKEEREIKSIEDKYINNNDNNKFGNVKKKDEKKEEDSDLFVVDKAVNKQTELCEIIEKVKLRRKKEKEKIKLIDNLLFKSDLKRRAINESTFELKHKKKGLNTSHESENDKSKISKENEEE